MWCRYRLALVTYLQTKKGHLFENRFWVIHCFIEVDVCEDYGLPALDINVAILRDIFIEVHLLQVKELLDFLTLNRI